MQVSDESAITAALSVAEPVKAGEVIAEMRDALKRLASFEAMTLEGWGLSHPELTARINFARTVLTKAEGLGS